MLGRCLMENDVHIMLGFGAIILVVGVCLGIVIAPLMKSSGVVTLSEVEMVLGNLCVSYSGSIGGVDYIIGGIKSYTVFCKGGLVDRNYTLAYLPNVNVSVIV